MVPKESRRRTIGNGGIEPLLPSSRSVTFAKEITQSETVRNIKSMSVDDRWKIAKEKKLCFRCLANNHQGRDCKRSKECGINGCKRNHDRLLHQFQEIQAHEVTVVEESSNSSLPSTRAFATVASDEPALPNAEQGIEEHSHLTTLASMQNQESASLQTVPIWLSANGKKIKVNALLDDASSVSYVNEELAGALGLSATYEQVTVNVLNESVETFDSMPVSMTLESCDGNVRIPFKALTCLRHVTGNYNLLFGQNFRIDGPIYASANFQNRQLILLLTCSLAKIKLISTTQSVTSEEIRESRSPD